MVGVSVTTPGHSQVDRLRECRHGRDPKLQLTGRGRILDPIKDGRFDTKDLPSVHRTVITHVTDVDKSFFQIQNLINTDLRPTFGKSIT